MATHLPSRRERRKTTQEEEERERAGHLHSYYSSLRGWGDGHIHSSYSSSGGVEMTSFMFIIIQGDEEVVTLLLLLLLEGMRGMATAILLK